jgi:hypothetical protein
MPHMFHLVQYQQQGIKCVDITPELINTPIHIQGEQIGV